MLLQLPESCTSLLVGGIAFNDDAAPVVAQLTHLEYLCWHHAPRFTDAGLEQLMPLCLWRLYVYNCGLSVQATSKRDSITLDITWKEEVSAVHRQPMHITAHPFHCVFVAHG